MIQWNPNTIHFREKIPRLQAQNAEAGTKILMLESRLQQVQAEIASLEVKPRNTTQTSYSVWFFFYSPSRKIQKKRKP